MGACNGVALCNCETLCLPNRDSKNPFRIQIQHLSASHESGGTQLPREEISSSAHPISTIEWVSLDAGGDQTQCRASRVRVEGETVQNRAQTKSRVDLVDSAPATSARGRSQTPPFVRPLDRTFNPFSPGIGTEIAHVQTSAKALHTGCEFSPRITLDASFLAALHVSDQNDVGLHQAPAGVRREGPIRKTQSAGPSISVRPLLYSSPLPALQGADIAHPLTIIGSLTHSGAPQNLGRSTLPSTVSATRDGRCRRTLPAALEANDLDLGQPTASRWVRPILSPSASKAIDKLNQLNPLSPPDTLLHGNRHSSPPVVVMAPIEPDPLSPISPATDGLSFGSHSPHSSRRCTPPTALEAADNASTLSPVSPDLDSTGRRTPVAVLEVDGVARWVAPELVEPPKVKLVESTLEDTQDPQDQLLELSAVWRDRPRSLDSFDESNFLSQNWSLSCGELKHFPSGLKISHDTGVHFNGEMYPLSASDIELDLSVSLGSGASGVVYAATHKPTGAKVAVKSVRVESREKREQILHEIRGLIQAQACPYVVQWHAAFLTTNTPLVHVVLEHMDLGSLADLRRRLGPERGVPPELCLPCVVAQMFLGLRHLQRTGLLHRDVKPGNVLHSREGSIKLTDFGTSKDIGGPLSDGVGNTFVGTSTYMSPERLLGQAYSYPSDSWSAGIVVYELAVGRHPCDSRSFLELYDQMCEQREPRLPADRGFSELLCEFVATCLTRDLSLRPGAAVLTEHGLVVLGALPGSRQALVEWLSALSVEEDR